jgi:hypothetical protein
MMLPTIHSNGTSLDTLIDGYDAINEALYRLDLKWREVEFNARDYYPQGPDAYTQARDERQQHSAKIKEVRAYIDGIRQHLYDQLP